MVYTLNGILKTLGAEGFKRYAHDYGNERVAISDTVDDAVYILESYQNDKNLIQHFNTFEADMYDEYNSDGYVPFYKTSAFKNQCAELRTQGLFATDFF
jgi:hypothetical protein